MHACHSRVLMVVHVETRLDPTSASVPMVSMERTVKQVQVECLVYTTEKYPL